jgi:hypothetical protein
VDNCCYRQPVELLVPALVVVAVIIACVVYVALRDRRTSGERTRFESSPQGAPFNEEAGINQQGYWNGTGHGGSP